MEWLLGLVVILFVLGNLAEKITTLLKQLKSSGSVILNKGFEAKLSVVPIDKKSEDVHKHPHN